MTTYQPLIDFDYSLEAAVLGIMTCEADAFGKAYGMLVAECFYKKEHREIYLAMAELYDGNFPIDGLTIGRKMIESQKSSLPANHVYPFLTGLMDGVVSSAHLVHWCLKLRELAIQRTALAVTTSGIDRSTDVLDMAETITEKLRSLTDIKATNDWEDGEQVAIKLLQHMDDMKAGADKVWVTTGFPTLDGINGGFRKGQLVLLGARPGVGKSAMMGRMAIKAAHSGKKVGIITLEMDNKDVFGRMVSFDSDIPFYQLDRNDFYNADEQLFAIEAIKRTAKLPIHFSDTAQVNMRDIRAKAEKLQRKNDVDIIFIDYLQLIVPDASKQGMREQEVAKISRGCKLLAKLLEIPLVLMVQLNRQADNEEPQLKHLRESGSLEQDADIVMLLHRSIDSEDPQAQGTATNYIRKWRNGNTTKLDLLFDGERMRFMEISESAFKDVTTPNSPPPYSDGIRNAANNNYNNPNDVPF